MKRFIQTAIALSIMVASSTFANPAAAPATNNTPITPQERAKIEAVVHQYLLQKPEVLVEALQILQQRQYQEAEKTVKSTQASANSFAKALFNQNGDPLAGNPQGKVTVVEFFDYQCPHCLDMAPVIESIIKSNPDVRIVFKDFPIRGPMSETAAKAALAANLQGKYYQLNHALLTSKQQPLTEAIIFTIAQNVGLDVNKLKTDMNSPAIAKQLQANLKLAQDLKLFGTPAIFVGQTSANGNIKYAPGQLNQKQLQDLIDQAK